MSVARISCSCWPGQATSSVDVHVSTANISQCPGRKHHLHNRETPFPVESRSTRPFHFERVTKKRAILTDIHTHATFIFTNCNRYYYFVFVFFFLLQNPHTQLYRTTDTANRPPESGTRPCGVVCIIIFNYLTAIKTIRETRVPLSKIRAISPGAKG